MANNEKALSKLQSLASSLDNPFGGMFHTGGDVNQRLSQTFAAGVLGAASNMGQTLVLDSLWFKTSAPKFKEFLEALADQFKLLKISHDRRGDWAILFFNPVKGDFVSLNSERTNFFTKNPDDPAAAVIVDPGVFVSISTYSVNEGFREEVSALIDKFEILEIPAPDEDPASPVHVLSKDSRGVFRLLNLGICATKLSRQNYSEDTLRKFDDVVRDIEADNPTGRLAIFEGPPGTGKTHMIKALLALKLNAAYVVIPPHVMPDLASPELISVFNDASQNHRKLVLILEDADDCLVNRDQNEANMSAISSILNLSDGLIGNLLNLYILATTNTPKMDFDPAVKRKGRLTCIANVGPLETANPRTRVIAQNIDPNLTDEEYEAFVLQSPSATLGDIYGYFNDLKKQKTEVTPT